MSFSQSSFIKFALLQADTINICFWHKLFVKCLNFPVAHFEVFNHFYKLKDQRKTEDFFNYFDYFVTH